MEHHEIRDLVKLFLHALNNAVTSDCHVAHRYGKLLRKLWFADAGITDLSLNVTGHGGDHSNPEHFPSYKESTFGPMLDDTGDDTTPGFGLRNPEANYRLAPEFDLLYQSFFNLDTDPFNPELSAGIEMRI